MTLDPTLMSVLACPSDDHAPLREEWLGDTGTLVCTFCATRYPVQDGIPVLLLDDATPGPNGVGVAAEPDVPPAAEVPVVEVPVVEVPVVEVPVVEEPEVAPPPVLEPPTVPPVTRPGSRSRTSGLRDRVQQRLAELEATRGPRGKRRGDGGT